MGRIVQITNLLFVAFLASACLPMATPTPAATALVPLPTLAEKYYSLDTPTTIEEIDTILAAVNSTDKQKLTDIFSYTTIACKTIVNALGGPPPCPEGKAEGTLVEWNGNKLIRVSVQGYNTKNDIDKLCKALSLLLG